MTSYELFTSASVNYQFSIKRKFFYDLDYSPFVQTGFPTTLWPENKGRQVSKHPLASPFKRIYQWPNKKTSIVKRRGTFFIGLLVVLHHYHHPPRPCPLTPTILPPRWDFRNRLVAFDSCHSLAHGASAFSATCKGHRNRPRHSYALGKEDASHRRVLLRGEVR